MKRIPRRILLMVGMLAIPAMLLVQATPAQDVGTVPNDPVPPIRYVMAAPRGAIVAPPKPTPTPHPAYGAAYNFPRRNGTLTVPVGAAVLFREAEDIEGVWYPHAYGHLATRFELQMLDRSSTGIRWITIGVDGARDTRVGPSIGTADVGVPFRFERPGRYLLRAIIRTVAVPMDQNADAVEPTNDNPFAAVAEDTVYVGVRVVDHDVDPVASTADPADEAAAAMQPGTDDTSGQ